MPACTGSKGHAHLIAAAGSARARTRAEHARGDRVPQIWHLPPAGTLHTLCLVHRARCPPPRPPRVGDRVARAWDLGAHPVSVPARPAPQKVSKVASAGTQFYGPDRVKWLGPYSENSCPAYLTGEFPGDYGELSRAPGASHTRRRRPPGGRLPSGTPSHGPPPQRPSSASHPGSWHGGMLLPAPTPTPSTLPVTLRPPPRPPPPAPAQAGTPPACPPIPRPSAATASWS